MRLTGPLIATAAAIALTTATFLLVLPCPGRAHDESATIGDLAVTDVAATAARAGESTKITFSVENTGFEQVTITGVRLPTGERSRVIGFYGTSHSGEIGGFPVGPGETGRLDGRNAWVEVGPLSADLSEGSVITGRLLWGRFEAPLAIHVVAVPTETRRQTASTQGGFYEFMAGGGPAWLTGIKC